MKCYLCPRRCGIDRELSAGACGAEQLPRVARAALHMWEEPCISGMNGSGAIFFSGCNLGCIFCQNHVLQNGKAGYSCDASQLAEHFLSMQKQGAHNLNLVTPTPHLQTIIPAICMAKEQGLTIPIVYNTNSYETVDALRRLEGLVDIYLPDFKYVSSILSKRFSHCSDYFSVALAAIQEMQRQVGVLTVDSETGLARHGMLIRHLVLPGCIDDSRKVLDTIAAEFSLSAHLSLMRQYTPTEYSSQPPLNRRLTDREYDRIVDYCSDLGFKNVWIQGKEAATLDYTPEFIIAQ